MLTKKIYIAATGITKFGELWDQTFYDLCQEACRKALRNWGSSKDTIDAIYVGNMIFGKISGQDHLGAVVASLLGIKAPAVHIEAACASGGMAVNAAVHALEAGIYKNVLVLGVEKMTDCSTSDISSALMGAGSERERLAGLTFPALYALMAKAHMRAFKTTSKQLAAVSVKNHYNASLNEHAQYPFEISLDKALASPMVADPLTLFDTSPITDGAAAVILSVSKPKKKPVHIAASAAATDTIDLAQRQNFTEIKATKTAARHAYAMAGISAKDIDVAEVHDCFTISEIMAMEDLGFCKKGHGGAFVASGKTALTGTLPVNTSGGLKACGHPVGATGVKQIIEITRQLQGTLGKRQVKDVRVGLTQNVGGTGATVVIHILKQG